MLREIFNFSVGLVVGYFAAGFLVNLFLAPDPVQKEAARQSQCKSVKETLEALEYEPEEWGRFYSAHESIIRHCETEAKR